MLAEIDKFPSFPPPPPPLLLLRKKLARLQTVSLFFDIWITLPVGPPFPDIKPLFSTIAQQQKLDTN